MDKETLSNYGWIVVCVLVLACMLALATPFGNFVTEGFKATYVSFWQGGNNAIETVMPPSSQNAEQIEQQYDVKYYDSLATAVNDVNANEIGKNANVAKKDAKVGVYIDGTGETVLIVFKNLKEEQIVSPAVNMTIKLNGKTFDTTQNVNLNVVSGKTIIDAKTKNSKMVNNKDDALYAVSVQSGAECKVKGGTFEMQTKSNASAAIILNKGYCEIEDVNCKLQNNIESLPATNYQTAAIVTIGTSIIRNAKVEVQGTIVAYGIIATISSTVEIYDTTAIVHLSEGSYNAAGLGSAGSVYAENCVFNAYSNINEHGARDYGGETAGVSIGRNAKDTTLINCKAYGTATGLLISGTATKPLYINGGTYEGSFIAGLRIGGTQAHTITNAEIAFVASREGYVIQPEHYYYAAIAVSQSPNARVFVDNCSLKAPVGIISVYRLMGTDEVYPDIKLYVSNSKWKPVDKGDNKYAAMTTHSSHTVFLGKGNEFGEESILSSKITKTEEVYGEKPQ